MQALALGTPHHAAISTALPLVDGGPRRLVHGVFSDGDAARNGRCPKSPRCPSRWRSAGARPGARRSVEAAARLIAAPPPIDLIFKDEAAPPIEGVSLLPGHLRVPAGTAVADLPGYAEGTFWVQDISAAEPARLLGAG